MKIYKINGDLIYEDKCKSIKTTVEAAVRKGVCLNYAELNHANLNNAYLNNAQPILPKLTIQYADFAVWQRKHYKRSIEHIEYWKV